MKNEIIIDGITYKVGDYIFIKKMKGEPRYNNVAGEITTIDDADQIHGTWGGCAIIPDLDEFEKIERPS